MLYRILPAQAGSCTFEARGFSPVKIVFIQSLSSTLVLDTFPVLCHYLIMPTSPQHPALASRQKQGHPRQARSADVALRAGVSRSTVSVVLNGHREPISPRRHANVCCRPRGT